MRAEKSNYLYKTKQILSLFFSFLLFLSVFDMFRSGFNPFFFLPEYFFRWFNTIISVFRDLLLFILVFFIFLNKKTMTYRHSFFYILILVMCQYSISVINSVYNNDYLIIFINMRYLYWYIRPFVFLYVLYNKNIFYLNNDLYIVKNIIIWSLSVFILTLITYTIFPFLIVGMRLFPRIGIGNMAIQSSLYYCAFMMVVYFQPFTFVFNSMCAFLFICAILLSITNTGIIAVAISVLLFLFYRKTRKMTLSLCIFGFVILFYMYIKYLDEIMFFVDLFTKRMYEIKKLINKIFFHKDTFISSSLGFRERQIDYFLSNLTVYDIPFGSGEFTLSKNGLQILENIYFSVFHDFGLMGIFTFILFKLLKIAVIDLLKNGNIFGINVFIGFCVYGTTLSFISHYSMSCLFMFTFYLAYFRRFCNI